MSLSTLGCQKPVILGVTLPTTLADHFSDLKDRYAMSSQFVFVQQTCLLCDTAETSAVSHSRHVCCATQQTCLLCQTADMSAVWPGAWILKVRSIIVWRWVFVFSQTGNCHIYIYIRKLPCTDVQNRELKRPVARIHASL